MLKRTLVILIVLVVVSTAKSQTLNWHLTAQAGTANYQYKNFQGAFLAGFKNPQGQQFSVGPVVKGYNVNAQFTNLIGGRIYSQAKLFNEFSIYLQGDVFSGMRSSALETPGRSPMRLETGAGIIYTYNETIGLSAGYNLGELNPVNGVRKNTPSIKLVYLMPLGGRW